MKKILLLAVFLSTVFMIQAQTIQKDVLTYTNQLRQANGKPALVMKDELNVIAQQHSLDMAQHRSEFGHDGFDDREQQAALKIPALKGFAENVAYGPKTGKEVVEMWTNSKGHKKNMLGNYRFMGIGIATSSTGQIYYTQVFVN